MEGVSIFDLIIPWKQKDEDPKKQAGSQKEKKIKQTSLTSFLGKPKISKTNDETQQSTNK
jgi:hypothetical protein